MTRPPVAVGPPRRTWDLVLTIVLLVLLVCVVVPLSYFALFLGMMSDPCGGTVVCNFGAVNAGVLVALFGPLAVFVVALVAAIVLLRRRRIAFWIPLVGGPLAVAVWLAGAAVASSGVPT